MHHETIELQTPSKAPWVLLLLVLGGAGAAGYWGWKERERLLLRATTAGVEAAKTETARKVLEEELKKVEAERVQLVSEKAALEKSVGELKGTHDKLNEKMKDEIARGDILVTTADGRLRVDLVDKILFESGDARISKRGEGVLMRLGAVLKEIDDKQIHVSGHTDNARISRKLAAQFPTNWELSVVRATHVVRFLEERAAVPPERLVASGRGQHQPVAANRTATGRARNRRIEILLTPSLAPKRISTAKLKEQAAQDDTQAAKR